MKTPFLLLALTVSVFAQDTDNDGASDSFEIATGFDPSSNTSTPPATPAIGINFRRSLDPPAVTSWASDQVNGYIPQENWNQCVTNSNEPIADQTRIQTPTADQASNAENQATTLTFSSEFHFASWNGVTGSEVDQLMAGYLLDRGDSVSFQANNVPYTNYDVYAYLSGPSNFALNTVHLNRDGANPQAITVRPRGTQGPNTFRPTRRVAEGIRQAANVVVFKNLNSVSFTIHVDDDFGAIGLAAIQIVDRNADTDGDTIPDWWELLHKTDASTSNATADPDADQLSNLNEYLRGSDPNDPDTDDDGLTDFVETKTGTYANPQDTGTDPTYPDTDDDRLSDYAEIYGLQPSNPNALDSDGDDVDDRTEILHHSDPLSSDITGLDLPQTVTANTFGWQTQPIQIKWDHIREARSESWLIQLQLEEISNGPLNAGLLNATFTYGLWFNENGVLTYRINAPNTKLWDSPDDIGIRVIGSDDIASACGFSEQGRHDYSDLLIFHLNGQRDGSGTWTLSFSASNQRTGQEIFRYTNDTITGSSVFNSGNSIWRAKSRDEILALPRHSSATDIYLTNQALDRSPLFSEITDTNDDGLPDVWATSFNITDGRADFDNDGLSNAEEYFHGTDPTKADTDGDGVTDSQEVAGFTDPTDSDSLPFLSRTTAPTGGDLNNNGLSDLWEARFSRGLSLIASADPDGDGFSNQQEDLAGTNPFDANSYLALVMAKEQDGLKLFWNSNPDKVTRLQRSDDLNANSFTNIPGASSGNTIPAVENREFYRITSSDQDRDNDGLTDAEERILGTNPTDANSSGRPIPQDLNGDGIAEGSVSGDYARFVNAYLNRSALESNSTPAPQLTPREASRFLMQATFGPTGKDIEELREMGLEAWLDDQIQNQPISSQRKMMDAFVRDVGGPRLISGINVSPGSDINATAVAVTNINTAFADNAVRQDDQLRQRMAFALTQFFVISRIGTNGIESPQLLGQFYDLLAEGAFGNYYDLLKKVTRNHSMGSYLSSINNQKADPSINRFPDENYAREVMQLFTIGVHELNNDGSLKRNENGQLIETYDQNDVIEMARVMTGFRKAFFDYDDPFGEGNVYLPMEVEVGRHDFGEKLILKRHTIPAREPSEENANQDIDDALFVLFNHENTPPFVSRAFIQFFVTDNPSPQYIERVANVFIDDGNGVRGNMAAVIRAILLDREARDIGIANAREEFGRLRDPLIRLMHLARLLHMERSEYITWWNPDNQFIDLTGQEIFSSPTVFNFYTPDHKPVGPLLDRDVIGGPFEIMDSITAVTLPNYIWNTITRGFQEGPRIFQEPYQVPVFYDEFITNASDNEALVDQLNLLVCAGRMTVASRQIIFEALAHPHFANGQNVNEKIQLALYLTAIAPESSIVR